MDQTLGISSGGASPGRGILWMLVTMALFVALDTTAKYMSQTYPLLQVMWARFFFQVLILAAILAPRLPGILRTRRLGLQILRSFLMLGAAGFFFSAISMMPLASASAIMFVSPIMVTALSVPLLGERVGPHRWGSVAVGFAGALIIIRPGTESMDPAALLAFGGACCYALYLITTRLLSAVDEPMTTLAYSALVGALASSLGAPFVWVSPALPDWVGLVMLGLLGGAGQFTLIKAFQYAPAATVAPFSYTSLLWATLFGFAVFGDLPDGWTVGGAAIIVASGLYIVHRERVRSGRGVKR